MAAFQCAITQPGWSAVCFSRIVRWCAASKKSLLMCINKRCRPNAWFGLKSGQGACRLVTRGRLPAKYRPKTIKPSVKWSLFAIYPEAQQGSDLRRLNR
jgi:hypothetical protein